MAEHFATQILFMVASIAFIAVILAGASSTMQDTNLERIAVYDETGAIKTFDDTWTDTGTGWETLGEDMPTEAFLTIAVPIIIIGGYIAIKTVSGILPNWLSGG